MLSVLTWRFSFDCCCGLLYYYVRTMNYEFLCCRSSKASAKRHRRKTAVVISTFSNDYFSLAVSVTHSFSSRVSKTGKFRYIIIVQYKYGTIAYYLEDILTFEFLSFTSTCTKQSIPCFSLIQLYDSSIVGKVVSP
jgi:hypothetical protein